jgi:hypothetical protein
MTAIVYYLIYGSDERTEEKDIKQATDVFEKEKLIL